MLKLFCCYLCNSSILSESVASKFFVIASKYINELQFKSELSFDECVIGALADILSKLSLSEMGNLSEAVFYQWRKNFEEKCKQKLMKVISKAENFKYRVKQKFFYKWDNSLSIVKLKEIILEKEKEINKIIKVNPMINNMLMNASNQDQNKNKIKLSNKNNFCLIQEKNKNNCHFEQSKTFLNSNTSLKLLKDYNFEIQKNQSIKNKMQTPGNKKENKLIQNSVRNSYEGNFCNKSKFSKKVKIRTDDFFQNYLYSKFNKLRPNEFLKEIQPLNTMSKCNISTNNSPSIISENIINYVNENNIKGNDKNISNLYNFNSPIQDLEKSFNPKYSLPISDHSEVQIKINSNSNKSISKFNWLPLADIQLNLYSKKSTSDPFIENYFSSLNIPSFNNHTHDSNLIQERELREIKENKQLAEENQPKELNVISDTKSKKESKVINIIPNNLFKSQKLNTLSHYNQPNLQAKHTNIINYKKKTNFDRFDKLYIDYKNRNVRNKLLQDKFTKAQGFLFSPKKSFHNDKLNLKVRSINKDNYKILTDIETTRSRISNQSILPGKKKPEIIPSQKNPNNYSNLSNTLYSFLPLHEQNKEKSE